MTRAVIVAALGLVLSGLLAFSVVHQHQQISAAGSGAGAAESITSPDTAGNTGADSSLALDANGRPVVSYVYHDGESTDLKVLHCNDANCSGGDESTTSPDTEGNPGGSSSLALDAAGNPVVSYWAQNSDLKVLHCNDANCSGGGESITAPDTGAVDGVFTSLALDAAGNPVVSYAYNSGVDLDLKVLHCNDANCSGGGESITAPDTLGDVGYYTSLALDATGNPVLSYTENTYGELRVMHCNDSNCAGGDENIVSPVTEAAFDTSLALDAAGNPVISYAYNDGSNPVDLKVLHCNDVNCAGGDDSIASPRTSASNGGYFTSLALDGAGNPVVSFLGCGDSQCQNQDLQVLHCNDADCAGGDDSITSPDAGGRVGYWPSLELDKNGNPVVSYTDFANEDLKVLHCNDANCSNPDIDGDGCLNTAEQQTAIGSEQTGGRRDPLNPWDFYDIDGNNQIDLFYDIFGVAFAFGQRDGDPGYSMPKDRSPPPPSWVEPDPTKREVWDMGAPDGVIDLFVDIFGVAFQYGHDCT